MQRQDDRERRADGWPSALVEAFDQEMDELVTDDGGRVDPGQPLEARAVPKTDEIPDFGKVTPKGDWMDYRAAVAEATKHYSNRQN